MRQGMWLTGRARRYGRSLVVLAALATAAAGCGGSSPPSAGATSAPASTPASSAPATGTTSASAPNQAAAAAEIKRAFVTFFDGRTPAATKIGLVQNGQRFAPVIEAQATSPLAKSTTATVSKVTLTSPSAAAVTYTVLLGGKPALQDQAGRAVLVNGSWKVAAVSFCQLLALEGQKVAGCPGAG